MAFAGGPMGEDRLEGGAVADRVEVDRLDEVGAEPVQFGTQLLKCAAASGGNPGRIHDMNRERPIEHRLLDPPEAVDRESRQSGSEVIWPAGEADGEPLGGGVLDRMGENAAAVRAERREGQHGVRNVGMAAEENCSRALGRKPEALAARQAEIGGGELIGVRADMLVEERLQRRQVLVVDRAQLGRKAGWLGKRGAQCHDVGR